MKKTKYLLIIALPLIFAAGCIDGVAVLSINKDGSGKVTFEGLFDYAAYCAVADTNCAVVGPFFLSQIKKMLTSGGFVAWNEVTWRLLDDGKCYFKGTAYFRDINKTDFFIGSVKSNLKIFFNSEEEPVLELKYSPDGAIPENQRMESLPPSLFTTLNMSLVVTLPANIKETENFELLDPQTAMFVLEGRDLAEAAERGRLSEYFRNKGAIRLVLTSAGEDLFDYQSQVQYAQNEFEKILKRVQITQAAQNSESRFDEGSRNVNVNDKLPAEKSNLKNEFNARIRQGLMAEVQGDFNEALKIYKNITDDANADEKYRAAAGYQTGVCLLKMGDKEKAIEQFEYVIGSYPLERTAALKSVKMLQNIRSGKTDKKTQEQKQIPFVVDTIPELYSEDVDPNVEAVKIVFSEPMKKTDWFYSSFAPAMLPDSAGQPSFDEAGLEWTLPVKLKAGKVYAVAVNYGDAEKNIRNLQTGFRSIWGQKCEKFVLVFATADEERLPTLIDEKIIEKCERVNFPQ